MHSRCLFLFTSDSPLDELMKWKEDLPGLFSAQSRTELPQAREQIGERKPALLLSDARCPHERTDVLATGVKRAGS